MGPLADYKHDHPPIINLAEAHVVGLTAGQRLADRLAALVGSWPFIAVQSTLLVCWIVLNVVLMLRPGAMKAFDPFPFILLNLVLSFQAAYTGPVVMMSQNRQAQKDRMTAQSDYQINVKAEEEIAVIMRQLAFQSHQLAAISDRLDALQQSVGSTGTATSEQGSDGSTLAFI